MSGSAGTAGGAGTAACRAREGPALQVGTWGRAGGGEASTGPPPTQPGRSLPRGMPVSRERRGLRPGCFPACPLRTVCSESPQQQGPALRVQSPAPGASSQFRCSAGGNRDRSGSEHWVHVPPCRACTQQAQGDFPEAFTLPDPAPLTSPAPAAGLPPRNEGAWTHLEPLQRKAVTTSTKSTLAKGQNWSCRFQANMPFPNPHLPRWGQGYEKVPGPVLGLRVKS